MSWLREHFRTFVIPGFTKTGSHWSYEPSDTALMKMEPSPKTKRYVERARQMDAPFSYLEIRLLRALVLDDPPLIPRQPSPFGSFSHSRPWEPIETWRRIRNSFRSVASICRKLNRTLLLPGRDVWVYEVLAKKSNLPSIFIPSISRAVANSDLLDVVLEENNVTGKEIMLDTGFVGSIPKAIGKTLGKPVDFLLLSQDRFGGFHDKPSWVNTVATSPYSTLSHTTSGAGASVFPWEMFKPIALHNGPQVIPQKNTPNQVFPQMAQSRSLALWLEYLPKYWNSGRTHLYDQGFLRGVHQHFSTREEFLQAACLTACLWHGLPNPEAVYQWVRTGTWGKSQKSADLY